MGEIKNGNSFDSPLSEDNNGDGEITVKVICLGDSAVGKSK